MAAVNLYVLSDVPPNAGIQGVSVGVFDPTTFTEIAVAQTDANGMAAFLLDVGVYEVRLQKSMTRFLKPYRIEVTDLGPNGFTTYGSPVAPSTPIDVTICRCTAFLKNLANAPIPNLPVQVVAKVETGRQVPKVLSGNLLAAEGIVRHTDAEGMVFFDLPRCGEFNVVYAGEEDHVYPIKVPDRASANLIDLMFPFPVSLEWDAVDAPSGTASIKVGENKLIHWKMNYSDFQKKSEGIGWLQFENSDSTVARVLAGEGALLVSGLAPGTIDITATTVIPLDATSRFPAVAITVPVLHAIITV